MRKQIEINNEYSALCARLGDIEVKKDSLDAQVAQLKEGIAKLNAESLEVMAAEAKEKADAEEKAKAETEALTKVVEEVVKAPKVSKKRKLN